MPTANSLVTAQNLYVRYYGRPADPSGLTYWASQIDANGLDYVLAAFANSAESQALYGSGNLAGMIVAAYQNMFGRDPLSYELNYWVSAFSTVPYSFVNLVMAIGNACSGDDLTSLNNKESAATMFTGDITGFGDGSGSWYSGATVVANARNWLVTITTVAASAVDVNAACLTQYNEA